MKNLLKSVFFVFVFLSSAKTFATHIVGGVVYYKKLAGNDYEIKLIVYRDCANGVPPFDDPASIGFFDAATNSLYAEVQLSTADSVNVPNFVNNDCFIPPVNICYRMARYTFNVTLPPNVNGYIIAYQRCCRNNTISNIITPESTGATYLATIPSSTFTTNNSNPVFQNDFPPNFICLGFPFVYDHSATDLDGDSLVYELCTPLDGASFADPIPQPPFNPPYSPITFISPYSQSNMLNGIAGGAALSINSQTGLLTATPTTLGQFVVGVCVKEYRGNIFLGTTRRDVQFNVIPCPSLIVADFSAQQSDILTLCGTFHVDFINQSFGASTYEWDFGDLTSLNDTSTMEDPSYTFPDTGLYTVTLIAHSAFNPNCADTAYATVSIRPELTTDFTFSTIPCSYNVQFNDLITNNSGTLSSLSYNFGDNTSSSVSDPLHSYSSPGTYTVTLVTSSVDGCIDTVQKQLTLPAFVSASTNATSVFCNNDCNGVAWVLPVNGVPPYSFQWSNSTTNDSLFNLCAGTYTVTVTDSNGCSSTQSITVTQPQPLTSFASKTDDYCGAICIGTVSSSASGGTPPYSFNWSNGQTGSYLKDLCQGTYTVTITDSRGCTTQIQTVTVGYQNFYPSLTVSADKDTIFNGQSVQLTAVTNGATYTWTPSGLLNNATISNPVATPVEPTTFIVTINDSLGCPVTDSVTIFVKEVICHEPAIFIPNAFTPNDDNSNDIFRVRGDQIKELLVRVYDRWGEKVFETTTPGSGWDGTYNGKKVNPGVFVYYVESVCFNNEKFFKKGNVTVIR